MDLHGVSGISGEVLAALWNQANHRIISLGRLDKKVVPLLNDTAFDRVAVGCGRILIGLIARRTGRRSRGSIGHPALLASCATAATLGPRGDCEHQYSSQ